MHSLRQIIGCIVHGHKRDQMNGFSQNTERAEKQLCVSVAEVKMSVEDGMYPALMWLHNTSLKQMIRLWRDPSFSQIQMILNTKKALLSKLRHFLIYWQQLWKSAPLSGKKTLCYRNIRLIRVFCMMWQWENKNSFSSCHSHVSDGLPKIILDIMITDIHHFSVKVFCIQFFMKCCGSNCRMVLIGSGKSTRTY